MYTESGVKRARRTSKARRRIGAPLSIWMRYQVGKSQLVLEGAICREPDERRCIINLSDGGEDAVTLREFDLGRGAFVEDGFSLPSGKQDVAWLDADTLLLAREWQPGEMTRSGYAFVVKLVKRGQPLAAAVEVYRGSADDVGVSPIALSDGSGHSAVFIQRAVSIFEFDFFSSGSQRARKIGAADEERTARAA